MKWVLKIFVNETKNEHMPIRNLNECWYAMAVIWSLIGYNMTPNSFFMKLNRDSVSSMNWCLNFVSVYKQKYCYMYLVLAYN